MILYAKGAAGKPRRPLFSAVFGLVLLLGGPGSAQGSAALLSSPPPNRFALRLPADSVRLQSRRWYEGNLLRAVAVPAVLIGYGVSVRGRRGFYSSQDSRNDVRRVFGDFRSRVDDGLVFVPYAELAALALLRVPERHDRFNTALLVAKSTGIAVAAFSTLKYTVRDRRPDDSNDLSFPSGHTAMAFCAASLVHQEFRARSPWPGVGAYVVATGVGVFRMVNDRHWQADVLAGAGIGILAVHAAYLTHRYRWGHRPEEGAGAAPPRVGVRVVPWAWPGAGAGLGVVLPLP